MLDSVDLEANCATKLCDYMLSEGRDNSIDLSIQLDQHSGSHASGQLVAGNIPALFLGFCYLGNLSFISSSSWITCLVASTSELV